MLEKYDSLFILKFTFHWVSYFYLLNLATQTLRDLVYWTELVVEVLEAGGRPKKTMGGWKGEASGMVGMAHQPSFHLPQSPTGGQRAHSKPKEKPLPQPPGEQQPEDTQVSREQGTEVTGPPKAEGRGGRRAREILLLPGWRSEHPAIALHCLAVGCGRTPVLGLPASCHFSHQGTLSAKATFFRFFRAEAGPATGSHRHVPVYAPEHSRVHQRPCRVRPCERA